MASAVRREPVSYPPGQLCYELHWDTETSSSGETPSGRELVQLTAGLAATCLSVTANAV